MKKLRFISTPALVIALALTFVAGPVFAEHGNSEIGTSHAEAQAESSDSTDNGNDHMMSGHDDTMTAAEHQQEAKDKSEAARQHVCESHKKGLENKFSHMVTNSQRIEDQITGILNKTVAYQQDNNVSADNFDSLVATAQSAQSDSDAAIANLKTVTPSLDCNNVSVADDVANFKTAATTTRDSLKAYRDSVIKVIQSLLNAKQTDNTEGSNQ